MVQVPEWDFGWISEPKHSFSICPLSSLSPLSPHLYDGWDLFAPLLPLSPGPGPQQRQTDLAVLVEVGIEPHLTPACRPEFYLRNWNYHQQPVWGERSVLPWEGGWDSRGVWWAGRCRTRRHRQCMECLTAWWITGISQLNINTKLLSFSMP